MTADTSGASDTPANTPASPTLARPPRRRLSAGRRAGFALVLLGLLLVLAEGLARLVVPAAAPGMVPHPYLRHVRAPGSSYTVLDPWTREPFTIGIDDHGLRASSFEPPGAPKAPGSYRIVFVGASTTENVALPDERTFPVLVERMLAARLPQGPVVRVANAAISGNTVADSFSLVAHRALALEPDLIVMLEGINDVLLAMSPRFDPTHYADRRPERAPSLRDLVLGRSRLAQAVARAGARLEDTDGRARKLRELRRDAPFSRGLDPTRGAPYLERYLRMSAAVCRAQGVPLLLMTQPTLYEEVMSPEEDAALWMGVLDHGALNVDTPTLLRGMRAANDAVRAAAKAEGALLLDLDAAVPKDLVHFYDDCHYTARGNEVVARAIVDALLASGRLP